MNKTQDSLFDNPGEAVFSDDRRYRYKLTRKVPSMLRLVRRAVMIGLNPSIADETRLDPTLKRFMGFCMQWCATEMVVVNLFGLVSTDPRGLREVEDPIGPENDQIIANEARTADILVACWGAHPMAAERAQIVLRMIRCCEVKCFGLTKGGSPKHPLYLPSRTSLVPFEVKL
jgi:hypothetical protein